MQDHVYQSELSQRIQSACAFLDNGDLSAALDSLEAAVSSAEQNMDCAHRAPALQIATLAVVIRDFTPTAECNVGEYARIRDLVERAQLLFHALLVGVMQEGGRSEGCDR